MSTRNTQTYRITTNDDGAQSRHRVPSIIKCFPVNTLFGGLVAVALTAPGIGNAQTLDAAVNSQLEIGSVFGIPCERLLDGDPTNIAFLEGGLLGICGRGLPTPGIGPSASSGGGAATPATLPSIVQQRLREVRGEKKTAITVTAASADAFVEEAKRWGLFVAAEKEDLDREVSTFEDGYDSDLERLTIGADYRTGQRWVAGAAFEAAKHDGDFKGGGDFDVRSYGLVGFGSFLPTDKMFIQFYGGFTRNSYDRKRVATFVEEASSGAITTFVRGNPDADYDASRYTAGILGGYDFPIRNVTISPFAGVDWRHIDFETYSESGNSGLELTFHGDDQTSLQSSVGVQASVALRSDSWAFVPQASVSWKHEFDQDQRNVKVSFVGDTRAKRFAYQTEKPDRNWGEINAGIVAVSPGGLQVFGNYRTLTEHDFFDSDAVTIGLRLPF